MKKTLCVLSSFLLFASTGILSAYAQELVSDENGIIIFDGLKFSSDFKDYYEFEGVEDTSLTTITFPDTVNGKEVYYSNLSTGNYFNYFSECHNLTEFVSESDKLYTEDGVLFSDENSIGYYSGSNQVQAFGKSLIAYPTAKEGNYQIPEDTRIITSYAFSKCTALTSVIVPDGVEFVCSRAFYDCDTLEEINGTLSINDSNAFVTCQNLRSISVKGTLGSFQIGYSPNLTSIHFEEDTCFGYESGFYPYSNVRISGCDQLKELTLPSKSNYNTLHIEIKDCQQLETIKVGESFSIYTELNNLPSLKNVYFENEKSENVHLDVTNCDNLTIYNTESGVSQVLYQSAKVKSTFISGDVNTDGEMDILDVITINKAILGKEVLTDEQDKIADLNKNGKVDSTDALMLMKAIVGLN